MEYSELNKYIEEITDISAKRMHNCKIVNNGHSFEEIYMILIVLGDVLHVDEENKRYVAQIKGGFLKKNIASLAIGFKEKELQIAIYAKEGLISQHTVEGVIDELKGKFS